MTKFALLIGFSYQNTEYHFHEARIKNDLTFVYQKVQTIIPAANISIVTDTNINLPHHQVHSNESFLITVYTFAERLKEGDQLLVYFSGHGIRGRDGTRLLITATQKLPVEQFNDFLGDLPYGTRVFLVLDCCDAEGVVEIDQLPDQKVVVLAACRNHQLAGFYREKNISLFTYYLFSIWGRWDLSVIRNGLQREINKVRIRYNKPLQEIVYQCNRSRHQDHVPDWFLFN